MTTFEQWWAPLAGLGEKAKMTAENAMLCGYALALERVARFGDELKGDKALSDEERYILAQAAEVLEAQGL